jgi:hypothetical protein
MEELGKKMKIEMDSNSNYGHLKEAKSLQGTSRSLSSLLMLRLFRRKMVSVVKWFQGSHFSRNHFPSKAFSFVWCVRKIANIFLYFYSIILTYKN